jgi:hypothetical protein
MDRQYFGSEDNPMDVNENKNELKNIGYDYFIGVISFLSILNIILAQILSEPVMKDVLLILNNFFSLIFLGDFLYRVLTAPSKKGYFICQYGWADLLSCIPHPIFKLLRFFRLYIIGRLIREAGIRRRIAITLLKDRAGSAMIVLLVLGIMMQEFASLAILKAEQPNPSANIKTASDALWYVIVTIATVGYGDRYPTTDIGRIIGSVLIIIGVGIFGTFTAFLANLFLAPREKGPDLE